MSLVWFLITVGYSILFPSVCHADELSPIVYTNTGAVQGRVLTSRIDPEITYNAFTAIPYAEPPVGSLRFKDPIPKVPWTGVLNATIEGPACVRPMIPIIPAPKGQEDCLYLNVYTRNVPVGSELKSVIFWVHGGGFFGGEGLFHSYAPDFLIDKDVVIVTINYRVNVFGFLATNSSLVPGNAGLKDMVQALRWVYENIAQFGGNPNDITAFGESAGGGAVHFLTLSPLTKGLIKRAISDSGTAVAACFFQPRPMDKFFQLAKGLGISSSDVEETIAELQKVDADILLDATFDPNIMVGQNVPDRYEFVPVAELFEENAFLTKSPYEVLENGEFNKVDYLLGFNTAEGMLFYMLEGGGMADLEDYVRDASLVVPLSLNVDRKSDLAKYLTQSIIDHYFDDDFVKNSTNFVNFFSDFQFIKEAVRSIEFMRKYMTVYAYQFSYRSEDLPPALGTAHGEELRYIWINSTSYDMNDDDKKMIHKMTTMWTNFAKFGNPTPTEDPSLDNMIWRQVPVEGSIIYLDIDSTLREVKDLHKKDYEFWKDMYDTYAIPPHQVF